MGNQIDRATIKAGPGWFNLATTDIYSKDGIDIDFDKKTWEAINDLGGNAGRADDWDIGISLTPSGEISAGILAQLYPSWLTTPVIGHEIFSGTDVPGLVTGLDGSTRTFSAVALVEPPSFEASGKRSAFGKAKWRSLGANNTALSTASSRLAIASTTPAPAPALANIFAGPYTIAWGASPFAALLTEGGVKVTPKLELEFGGPDGHGISYAIVKHVGVTAELTVPVGLTDANVKTLMDMEKLQGSTLVRNDLVITHQSGVGFPLITLKAAELIGNTQHRFAQADRRFKKFTFRATFQGSGNLLFSVALQ